MGLQVLTFGVLIYLTKICDFHWGYWFYNTKESDSSANSTLGFRLDDDK